MSESSDRLLEVVSARRRLSWPAFKSVFDLLRGRSESAVLVEGFLGGEKHDRYRALRALDALGHCEVVFQERNGTVFVTPSVLCRLPLSGLPKAVLAGARSPSTLGRLAEICAKHKPAVTMTVTQQSDPGDLIPRRVVLEAESPEEIAKIAESLGILFESEPPAWKLLNLSASLTEYIDGLNWISGSDPNWLRKDFDSRTLAFESKRLNGSGLRLSRYSHPVHNLPICFLWNADSYADVEPDWGRYAVLQEHRQNVLIYDQRQFRLAVPITVPLPRLIERGLVLSSGFAPWVTKLRDSSELRMREMSFYVYEGVPGQIAKLAAVKVGQSLREREIECDLE